MNIYNFYFDGHTSVTDTGNVWTGEANLADNSTSTLASTATGGTFDTNNVLITGSSVPATGNPNEEIVQVRARIYGSTPSSTVYLYCYVSGANGASGTVYKTSTGTGYGSYDVITAPTGGWTWAAIRDLAASVYASDSSGTYNANYVQLEVTTSPNGHVLGDLSNNSANQAYTSDRKLVYKATANNSGYLKSAEAGMFAASTATINVRAVVYADNAGAPGNLLAVSDDTSFSSTALVRPAFTFSGANQIAITSGTSYWIGVQHSAGASGSVSTTVKRATTAGLVRSNNDAFSDGAASPFGTTATTAGGLDVFMIYNATPPPGASSNAGAFLPFFL